MGVSRDLVPSRDTFTPANAFSGGAGIILVVEDNAQDEALIRRALRRSGLDGRIVVVRDGPSAIGYLFGEPPAGARPREMPRAVLLDLHLPRVDGRYVLQQIRHHAHTRDIPVAVLTASDDERDRLGSSLLGATVYLSKARDLDAVGDILIGWLRPCDDGGPAVRSSASRVVQVLLRSGTRGRPREVTRHPGFAGVAASYRCVHGNRALLSALDEQDWDAVVVGFTEDESALQEAVELVRSRLSDVPIVLLADRHETDAASAWIARGVSEVVDPSESDRLADAIRRGGPSQAGPRELSSPVAPPVETRTGDMLVPSAWATLREARLATVLDDAGLAYWEQDRVTGAEACSANAAAMLGHGCPPGRDRRLVDAVHPEDVGSLRRTMDGVLGGGTPTDVLFRVTASGGRWRWLSMSMQVHRDAGGHVVALFGVLRPRDTFAGTGSSGCSTRDECAWTVDWDSLASRGRGGRPWVDRLAASIARSYQGTPLRLRAVAEAGDDDNLALLAHSVKGMALQLAVPALRDLAVETEHAAKARSPGASARARRLADAMDRVLASVVQHVDGLEPRRLHPGVD